MGQALYRKYRSKSLAEIVGQDHITTTLRNALDKGTIAHAYLFTGPRGVGKTSIARILAHEINKLPYDETQTHLDIIEIDAASNRRIDEIRELRERVHTAPASAKYKVYIIDEVHMLTKEAFNALLKTLEEPPAHVIFILATTEAHKLPETIISRTQRFSFKPAAIDDLVSHLGAIAKQESFSIEPEALKLIAQHGDGSFRDSTSMLDQASGMGKEITAEGVRRMLGIPPEAMLTDLRASLQSGDGSTLLDQLEQLREHGFLATFIARELGRQLRHQLINEPTAEGRQAISHFLRELLEVPAARDPEALLELILLGQLAVTGNETPEAPAAHKTPAQTVKKEAKAPVAPPVSTKPKAREMSEPAVEEVAAPAPKPKTKASGGISEAAWQQVLHDLKQKHSTLYSIARVAETSFGDNQILLEFAFPFHQRRLGETRNKEIMAKLIAKHIGDGVTLEVTHNKSLADKQMNTPTTPVADNQPLGAIHSIFGDAEIIE